MAEVAGRIGTLRASLVSVPARRTTQIRVADNGQLMEQLQSSLLALEQKRTELLTRYAPGYRLVQEVEQQIGQARAAVAAAAASPLRDETTDNDPTHEWVRTELARAESELSALHARDRAAARTVQAYQEDARAHWPSSRSSTRSSSGRSRRKRRTISCTSAKQEEARISEALDQQHISNVAIAEPVNVSGTPTSRRAIVLLVGVLFSLLGSGLLAVVADAWDPTFRTPDELAAVLGVARAGDAFEAAGCAGAMTDVFALPPPNPAARIVLDAEPMRGSLARERGRSDRTGEPFALLMLDCGPADPPEGAIDTLAMNLGRRLRGTDEVGWVGHHRIGVLLPHTDGSARGTGAPRHSPGQSGRAAPRRVADLPLPPACLAARAPGVRRTHRRRAIRRYARWNRCSSDPCHAGSARSTFSGRSVGLVLTAPILFGAIALIKLVSPGPAIFRQERTGLGGARFTLFKLRTMRLDAQARQAELRSRNEVDGPAFKIAADPRVIRFGRFLRTSSIDELPQFWNVLRGDMSLLGPRPLPCHESDDCLPWHRRRLDVTPGMSGLWQVSGRSRIPFDAVGSDGPGIRPHAIASARPAAPGQNDSGRAVSPRGVLAGPMEDTLRPDRPRLLLIAYACSPYRGSECAVGWHRAVGAAAAYETWVICEGSWCGPDIERYLSEHGKVPGLHFEFVHKGPLLRALGRVPGLYYLAYNLWHRRAFAAAQRLHRQRPFSLVHQATFCGYREPGYGARLGVPFVWGPVGGTQNYPWRFLPEAGPLGAARELLRSMLNRVQLRAGPRARRAVRTAEALFAANSTIARDLAPLRGSAPPVVLETGVTAVTGDMDRTGPHDPFRIFWCGELRAHKALPLLLKALAALPRSCRFELRVAGSGPERARWQRMARRYGLASDVRWLGHLAHADALRQYRWADVLAFTSLRDTSGNVVLEALAAGVPVICLDHQGVRDIVTSQCGIKVGVTTPREVIEGVRDALVRLSANGEHWRRLSRGAIERAREYLWAAQSERMRGEYSRVLAERGRARTGRARRLAPATVDVPSMRIAARQTGGIVCVLAAPIVREPRPRPVRHSPLPSHRAMPRRRPAALA